jgi:hypothetical protein
MFDMWMMTLPPQHWTMYRQGKVMELIHEDNIDPQCKKRKSRW